MRWLAAATALVVLASGCFGMCGPSVGAVNGIAHIEASFAGNKTVLHDALVAQGFRVSEEYFDTLRAQKVGQQVYVEKTYDNDTIEVRMNFDVPPKEFADGDAGSREALEYSRQQIEAMRPVAQAIVDALSQALGVPAPAVPMDEPGYGIC